MKLAGFIKWAVVAVALFASGFTSFAQQPEGPDIYEQAENEADRLQRVLDLEDWQVFYIRQP